MRMLPFLLLCFVIHSSCFAYTVILKSGKRIAGTLIGQDQSTLQLKDRSGILISFNKAGLDIPAMNAANQPISHSPNNGSSQRKESARTYTKDDLEKMPVLGIVEGDSQEPIDPDPEIEAGKSTAPSFSAKEEKSWRSRAVSLKKELAKLREKRIEAEAKCEQSRENLSSRLTTPQRKPINMLPLFGKPTACKMLEELTQQLDEAEERWDIFETEARRAEVPWQWLE